MLDLNHGGAVAAAARQYGLGACGWLDLGRDGWNDRTEAVHSRVSQGSITFYNHSPGTSHANDIRLFSLSAGGSDANVNPYRNIADHVSRAC